MEDNELIIDLKERINILEQQNDNLIDALEKIQTLINKFI
jgi:hypothetical protein